MKMLLLTVGGSCEPVIESILKNNPDRIFFICSGGGKSSRRVVTGEGHVCGQDLRHPDKPNILTQVGIDPSENEKYEIIEIDDVDNPNACYEICNDLISDIRKKYPSVEIIADYTGGTKSMTAGLIMAAMNDPSVILCVITGERKDLIRVVSGTQQIRLIGVKLPLLERQFRAALILADRYDYLGCLYILESILNLPDIPTELQKKIQKAISLARGFREWDKFNHRKALEILDSYAGDVHENLCFLKRVIKCRSHIDDEYSKFLEEHPFSIDHHGYELVEDLLLNAERKASQGLYDDATGRVYRSLELLVDIRLRKEYNINKNNLSLSKNMLPIGPQFLEKGKLGLKEAYDLLSELNSMDFLAAEYRKREDKIKDSLSTRNESIFAHGFTPIEERNFERFYSMTDELCRSFIGQTVRNRCAIPQFPKFSDIVR